MSEHDLEKAEAEARKWNADYNANHGYVAAAKPRRVRYALIVRASDGRERVVYDHVRGDLMLTEVGRAVAAVVNEMRAADSAGRA